MPDSHPDKKILEFPSIEKKLQQPTKQSVFERQKQEAEAKRLREEAETKAVYEDFVKSFDDEDDFPSKVNGFSGNSGSGGFGVTSGPPKRHFNATLSGPAARGGFAVRGRAQPNSGLGSLGPPSISFNKKRTHDGFQPEPSSRRRDGDRLGFESPEPKPRRAFGADDDDDEGHTERSAEPVVPKPTLRLSNLPPGTSPAVIKALIPTNLTVDSVRVIPPTGSTVSGDRKSLSAIVTLSKETPANDIDTAVGALQNKYLGYGFYLSLHRHLSSAALSSAPTTTATSGLSSQPFGAKPVHLDSAPSNTHGSPGQRGFAPPTSYAPGGASLNRNQPLLHVPVQAPRDIKELKLIHKTIESLLTHGPEFEALLMSRPEVQRDEKWAWLWDARSMGGVWYRWRLWEVLTGSETKRGKGKYLPLFEDSSAWKAPDAPLAYEYTTRLDEFVSDSEYNSSDDDESGDEGNRRPTHRGGGPPDPSNLNADDGLTYLNPLEKAKLTHLLARLPISTGQLRKGDVARVTAFAISHAGRGADEVVACIISNVEKPFAYTSANPERKYNKKDSADVVDAAADGEEAEDDSSSKLIGLYIISDILSSSSTSGVRHAWRYRQIFENALRTRKVFEGLGRLEKKMHWGKLRAEKWKRSVSNVLSLWEGWCVFPQNSQDDFVKLFNEPPLTKVEEEELKEKAKSVEVSNSKSKWKSVEESSAAALPVSTRDYQDVDGMAIDDSEGADGEPMDEDDVDGVPMEEDDDDEDMDGIPMEEDEGETGTTEGNEAHPTTEIPAREMPRREPPLQEQSPPKRLNRRPRAVDMFADSGSDGD